MDTISNLYNFIYNSILQNQFSQGAFIMGILGAVYQFTRPWPKALYQRIKRQYFYSVTIEQSDELYTLISQWVSENYPKKLRKVEALTKEKYGNGDYDSTDNKIKIRHYSDYIFIWFNKRLITIQKEREKLENADSFATAYLGRYIIKGLAAKDSITEIVNQAYALKPTNDNKTLVRRSSDGFQWSGSYEVVNKSFDNIFIPNKQEIIDKLDRFTNNKKDYVRRGIEWYMGILFYGLQGSGKSSLAKAIAKHTGRDIYIMNLATLRDASFSRLFTQMSDNACLIIDDIDIGMTTRDNVDKGVALSTLLSHLDGTNSRGDLIVVMTTNNKDKLDPAFLRKGRVDVMEEISFPDKECVEGFVKLFYDAPSFNLPAKLSYNKSMVDVQSICIENDNIEEARKQIIKLFKK